MMTALRPLKRPNRRATWLPLAALFVIGVAVVPGFVTRPVGASGAVLFEDDFNGPAGAMFDKTKWHEYSPCGYRASAAYGNIKCGEDERLDGQGHVVIPATPTRGQSLMTGDNFTFKYGTMSAWIKMPKQVGYWPAFWTLNDPANGKENPVQVGEIDVNETYTTWPTIYHAIVHNWNTNQALTNDGGPDYIDTKLDLSAAYHKYSAKVEPSSITFYFDDKQVGQPFTPASNPGKPWSFGPTVDRGNWLILSLAVGGAGGQQKPAVENAQMLVDRVEVLALPGSPTPTPSATPRPSVTATPTVAPTAAPKPGDINGDGKVNVLDLSALLSNWGKGGKSDLNGDGTTNVLDLSGLLSRWGS